MENPAPQGPIELTERQNAKQTSCPWTCKQGRPAPRGPACSSPSHGYPVCRRNAAGCSPRDPRSSAKPSRSYAEIKQKQAYYNHSKTFEGLHGVKTCKFIITTLKKEV